MRHRHATYIRCDQSYLVARKPYGCLSFLGDIFMTVVTGGFWLIWIFAREMRR